MPIVEREWMLSNWQQERIMWKVDLRTQLFLGCTYWHYS